MIYVPDELASEDEGRSFFRDALDEAAGLVRKRLEQKRPAWPIERLVGDLRSLSP